MQLILASNNAKKLAELQALFAGLRLTLQSQSALGIAEAEEPHASFVENALAKARHAARASGCAALADDSGLCVPAFGGAPGVASAHYAVLPGQAAAALLSGAAREAWRARQDAANNERLLSELSKHTDRRAWFVCTLVAIAHPQDPEPLVATARWHGRLLAAPQGEGGFGYDPLLWMDEAGCSVAQMSAAQKNANSHRALAAAQMRQLLAQVWGL